MCFIRFNLFLRIYDNSQIYSIFDITKKKGKKKKYNINKKEIKGIFSKAKYQQKCYKRSEISSFAKKSAEGDRSHRYLYISMNHSVALIARKWAPHLPTPHQFVNQKFSTWLKSDFFFTDEQAFLKCSMEKCIEVTKDLKRKHLCKIFV